MRDVPEVSGNNVANQAMLLANADQREIVLCREKKLAERELALIRTELRLLQEKADPNEKSEIRWYISQTEHNKNSVFAGSL